MGETTHKSAVVAIPPPGIRPPIDSIRRKHDRQARRWMPHITLLYPFRPRRRFAEVEDPLRRALRDASPFRIRLVRFRHFRHRGRSYTLWLDPEPAEPLLRLQASLAAAFPDCTEASRPFRPHLSVGQFRGSAEGLDDLTRELEGRWSPVEFAIEALHVIWRGDPPDDVFRVARVVPLGAA